MPRQVARLEITMDDQGQIDIEGSGELLMGNKTNKVIAFGLLELAKQCLSSAPKVERATLGDVERMKVSTRN